MWYCCLLSSLWGTPVVGLLHCPDRSSFCVCGVLLLCSTVQVSSLIFSPLNFDHSSHLKRLVWAVILFTKVFVAAHKFLKYDFYCTVQVITETLNITGFRIPVAELHPLEILSLFGWESLISRFENIFSANLIYLMVTISRFCFPLRMPCGQWQSFTAAEI